MMQVQDIGGRDPEIAVVAGVHGDETCGVTAIERFQAANIPLREPVRLIVANEEALTRGQRCIDTDLNRAFPGDPDSDLHEDRLAAALKDELQGCSAVLDLHSTRSYAEPFVVTPRDAGAVAGLIQATGVSYAVDISRFGDGGLTSRCNGVVVECGITGSDAAAEHAYRILTNWLAAQGVIEDSYDLTDPDVFRITGKEPKDASCRLLAENFERVDAGTAYAECEDGTLVADEPFYPVLMSEEGYDDILGFRAERIGSLSTYSSETTNNSEG